MSVNLWFELNTDKDRRPNSLAAAPIFSRLLQPTSGCQVIPIFLFFPIFFLFFETIPIYSYFGEKIPIFSYFFDFQVQNVFLFE